MASVKVAVRVRPLNTREKNMDAKCIIEMEGKRTSILNLKLSSYADDHGDKPAHGRERVKDFFFDYSYWSFDSNAMHFASQQQVFSDLGKGVLEAASEGYNACIFAYGQTGSGKTHTMMGQPGNVGLIPRICEGLFHQMRKCGDDGISFRTEVSYLEIYNEKVRDLLRPQSKRGTTSYTLKVREHPKEGPYVQGLSKHLVNDYEAVETLMAQGNSLRTTASTNMNDTSSRSHAIFTLSYTQAKFYHDMPSETTSKINLVDLAGSERADATGATGVRLKEGGNINKSLVTLGSVISSLAESSTNPNKKHLFIPYRDSVLTWLLKDSLGGNSKTIMIATISPADCNYAETLSTLRYANRAKNIINKPTVNEDPNVKLIRDLRAEIDTLKNMLHLDALSDAEKAAAKKLSENEERLVELTDKWKDRWKETQKIMQERELALKKHEEIGIRMDSELPHLVALEDDLLSTGILLYHLKEGKTNIGTRDADVKPDLVLTGPDVENEHCSIENQNGFVILDPKPGALCSVNGNHVTTRTRLQQGDVVILGRTNLFRFNHPAEAQELREKRKSFGGGLPNISMAAKFGSEQDLLQKLRSSAHDSREKREEELAKQLEEARKDLERQKQDEERRIEEAKNEFTRQIRDESRRLEETRRELQRQQRARYKDSQTAEEIRQMIAELEERYHESETRRVQKEDQLKEEVSAKEHLIKEQEQKLKTLQTVYTESKDSSDLQIKGMVEHFLDMRTAETARMKVKMKEVIQQESKDLSSRDIAEKKIEMKKLWISESEKVLGQEKVVSDLQNKLHEMIDKFEDESSISDEDKIEFEYQKRQTEEKLAAAHEAVEELKADRERALSVYKNDYRNRFDLLCWEREKEEEKVEAKKLYLRQQINRQMQALETTVDSLQSSKEAYDKLVEVEEQYLKDNKVAMETRRQVLKDKCETMQKGLDEEIRNFQEHDKLSKQEIESGRSTIEELKLDLGRFVIDLKHSGIENDSAKAQIDAKESEIADMESNLKDLEKKRTSERLENEEKVQDKLHVMNMVNVEYEDEVKNSNRSYTDMEQISREKILLQQENVDDAEKQLLQCRNNLDRNEERLQELQKLEEGMIAKADNELLFIAYLLEKDLEEKGKMDEFEVIHKCKENVENIATEYKQEVSKLQKQAEDQLKPMVLQREKAQVVLEDLVRSRGISEVALNEVKEQFQKERAEEISNIEKLKEKLADLEEETSLSLSLGRDEISYAGHSDVLNVNRILEKERQRLSDEMELKLKDAESKWASEFDSLKMAESEALAALEQQKEALVKELESERQKYQQEKLERESNELDRIRELETIIVEKEDLVDKVKQRAQQEITELNELLDENKRQIYMLQEKLDRYASMNSLALASHNYEDHLSDSEVADLLSRVRNSVSYIDEDDDESQIGSHQISPPPTPINRFLESVNIYKRNQIRVSVPRFILRGLGRNAYHVFEVKLSVGDDTWSVFRRYRKFRQLHQELRIEYPVVGNLEFPSKRFFGNRAESFVRLRRAQLEAYLKALFAILSNIATCPVSLITEQPLTKQDVGRFHQFFKQGVFEITKGSRADQNSLI
ncbi:kinesin-like protein KIF16B isoform X2 [Rhopilema esculentum]|uniref:kinesin-like protein KIF16B isoform X2 n=1 Tax=Rhopilema esculentum TaxID=499914 RepID=UPI0031DFA33B